jgi:predicted Zn-dependent protease
VAVPLKVAVLDSKEINAFALLGGFLFVERGLLEAVDDEAELAGVIGHEMSHVIARHGHKLMVRAGIMNILFQAAQIAAVLSSGGAGTFGVYAVQYGFYGLGFVLDLNLLGVSREFELQADQLGIQYTWNSGYDPTGFVRFFDKMATTKGYVEGASWFYDHPPFYERMIEAEREITFLPQKDSVAVQTSEFAEMKKALTRLTTRAKLDEEKRPSLLAEKGCSPTKKLEYEPGQDIETICSPAEK